VQSVSVASSPNEQRAARDQREHGAVRVWEFRHVNGFAGCEVASSIELRTYSVRPLHDLLQE